jgi:hypothetical protein
MKPVRLLVVLLASLLVLGLVAGGLALTPAVQRWAVLRAVRGEPGLKFDVDHHGGRPDAHPAGRGAGRKTGAHGPTGARGGGLLAVATAASSPSGHSSPRQPTACWWMPAASRARRPGPPPPEHPSPRRVCSCRPNCRSLSFSMTVSSRAGPCCPAQPGDRRSAQNSRSPAAGSRRGRRGASRLTATLNNPTPSARVTTLRVAATLRALSIRAAGLHARRPDRRGGRGRPEPVRGGTVAHGD